MDAEGAKRVAEAYIKRSMAENGTEYVVYDRPEESPEGWYFSYQSKRFVETNDVDLGLGLTQFRGHPEAFVRGVPDAQNPSAVLAPVPPPDG